MTSSEGSEELARLRALNSRLLRALEPFSSAYHESMDAALVRVVPLQTDPIPCFIALDAVKEAHAAFEEATRPKTVSDSLPAEAQVVLWCDGSGTTSDGPAGAGVVVEVPGVVRVEHGHYLGNGTNNVAELTAVLKGLLYVRDALKLPPQTPVLVHSDSEYVIGLCTQPWNPKKNQELVSTLRDVLKTMPGVRFKHVRGHTGVEGNEAADKLAGAAATVKGFVSSLDEATEILRAKRSARRLAV